MSSALRLSILEEMIPDGIEFGTAALVEFEPDSLWHETSLTIAAQALRQGVRTAYHAFQHPPAETRNALRRLGLEVEKLEDDGVLLIIDSYSAQTGLGLQENERFATSTLKLSDWSISGARNIRTGVPWYSDEKKRDLHIDDNLGILLQYNSEKALIDWFRTRAILETRTNKTATFHSFVIGVASDVFYRQFEQSCDGIIDFKSQEKEAEIEQYVRVRVMRGRRYNSRWRQLRLMGNGEVKLVD